MLCTVQIIVRVHSQSLNKERIKQFDSMEQRENGTGSRLFALPNKRIIKMVFVLVSLF